VSGTGDLQGVYFVGYDIRQPGGVLRSIGLQARQVAQEIAAARGEAAASSIQPGFRINPEPGRD
jgi:hypothetical protein